MISVNENDNDPHRDEPGRGHADGGHSHLPGAGADRRYLLIALGLLAAFMLAEVITAVLSGSLALLSDAGHMLSDVGAIGAALWAIRLAARPAAGAWTFGWKRAEILSAAANGITLLVVYGIVTAEAISRLIHPPRVDGVPVVVVAAAGIAVNIATAGVLARASRSSLNIQGAFRHVLTDLYGFIGTAAAGVIILATGWTRADAIASLVVVVLMGKAAAELLRASGRVLLEAAPEDMDLDDVRAHLLATEHVRGLHDLHAWTVTSTLPALSAHIVIDDSCFTDGYAPGYWISCKPASPGTSTSSTPPSSSRPPRTPATNPAPTNQTRSPPHARTGALARTGHTAQLNSHQADPLR